MKLFSKLKKETDRRLAGVTHQRDAEGRILIHMTVRDDSDFLFPFSAGENPVISSDVAEFLEARTESLPPNQPLTLRIRSNCIDDNEKVLYPKAITEYYTQRYAAEARALKRNKFLAASLALAGIIVLAILVILASAVDIGIWTEVIDIMAWVFLWEATDLFFFQGHALRIQRSRSLALLSMKVEFIDDSPDVT